MSEGDIWDVKHTAASLYGGTCFTLWEYRIVPTLTALF